MKEQTLSDKIVALGEDYLEDENYLAVIGYKDVKDFIKKLKEELFKEAIERNIELTDGSLDRLGLSGINETINKLAGDKLI